MSWPLDRSAPRVQYDIAYACFLVCGLGFVVIVGIFNFILEKTYLSFVTFLWFLPIALLTLVVGVGFSIRLWRHAPLPILSALALAFITVAFIAGEDSDEKFETALLWYGIIATVPSLGWFLIFRWPAHGAMGRDKSRPLYRGAPRLHYDIAYGCFLVFGLTALFGVVSAPIHIDHFAVLLLPYPSWVALVVGVGFSIRLWRHAPLSIFAALIVLFVLVGFFLDVDKVITVICADAERYVSDADSYVECATKQRAFWAKFITAVQWAYGITATVIPLWWFVCLRRRADGTMGSKA